MPRLYKPQGKVLSRALNAKSSNSKNERTKGKKGSGEKSLKVRTDGRTAPQVGPQGGISDKKEMIGHDILEWSEDNRGSSRKGSMKQVISVSKPRAKKKTTVKQHVPPVVTPSATSRRNCPEKDKPQYTRNSLALVVDNRVLQTFTGDAAARVFLDNVEQLLECLNKQGASPCVLASMAPKKSKSSERGGKGGKRLSSNTRVLLEPRVCALYDKLLLEKDTPWREMLEPVAIRAPVNITNTNNLKAIHVPKTLTAHDSWKLFSEVVHSIAALASPQNNMNCPLDVTILTNDISLLSDANEDSHVQGFSTFWETCRPHFQNKKIRRIKLLVVETGCCALINAGENLSEDADAMDLESCDTSARSIHLMNVSRCIRVINNETIEKSDRDFKGQTRDDFVPIRVEIRTVDNNRISFSSLSRKWLAERIASVDCDRRLRFDLPETLDGTQCTVDLDLSYNVLPFKADSLAAAGLQVDMELLSRSQIEVVALVPIAKIDPSLFFGVPFCARAGMESDLQRFREMESLVDCLWRYMIKHQVALFLRSTDGLAEQRKAQDSAESLYHMDGQTFILMAEETPAVCSNQELSDVNDVDNMPVANGVLFRCACGAQSLLSSGEFVKRSGSTLDAASTYQYTEYIENALDFLGRGQVNPLLAPSCHGNPEKEPSLTQEHDNPQNQMICREVEWKDESGVGANAKNLLSMDDSSDKSSGDEEDGACFTMFEYE